MFVPIKEYIMAKKEELRKIVSSSSVVPCLAIVQVGDNPSSNAYVKGKLKDADELGIKAILRKLPEDIREEDLYREVKALDIDEGVDGLIVQLPLPDHIDEAHILSAVSPKKDIDGFSPLSRFVPCTPKGIVDYLDDMGFPFKGKNALVIGRSNIVGKPLAKLLLSKHMNVTVTHSRTNREDMAFYIGHADLVCVAVGRLGLIDASYPFRKDAVVIDVGINRGEDGKLHGDVAAGLDVTYQSPVPGGVGLLTRLSLMKNVMEAKGLI